MLPRPEHWLFSIQAFLAGVLALAVAFWLDLPRPYWALATVYITAQPLTGATFSKSFYRAIGTLAGAAMAIAVVPNLVNAPPVLILAIAIWSGLCLYASILDRSPRGYAFMLAGYTTAIIGFPAVDAPIEIFDLALARTEEILVGIFCAALVSSLLFPRSVGPVVAERVALWLSDARAAGRDSLRKTDPGAREAHWLQLAADTTKIEALAEHLPFEATANRAVLPLVHSLVPRMLMTLPLISAVRDLMSELRTLGGASPEMAPLLARVDRAFAAQAPRADATLLEAIEAYAGARGPITSWRAFVELNLAVRLRDLVALFSDNDALARALASDTQSVDIPFAFPIDADAPRVRHDEHARALIAAATLSLALIFCCTFWILTSWQEGAAAAMMAAVAGSLFATQDDPVPSIRKFGVWSAIAVAVAGVYVFFILPKVHSFETLALVLAPALLTFGLLIAEPKTFVIGIALGIIMPTTMALQSAYEVDAKAFLNTGLAMVMGMAIAAATTAVLRVIGAEWRVAQFVRANNRSLAEVADIQSRRNDAYLLGLMFDRLSTIAPIVQTADEDMPDAMRQLRAGLNMVEARKTRKSLPHRARRRLDAALLRLRRNYRRHAPLDNRALEALDRAIQALRPDEAADRAALLALAGLRRCLFPQAAPLQLAGFGGHQ
ncbi:FUSC family protein [Methylocystis sp. MJC1]|uniref:FUSC family protein n=1 Tax=Methylocystis sp. MJC1 TaxID=2654282 RepID=UPI0013EA2371|nr:FUSC family protein [Methylocystis sp. MJC1]KAF2992497.1 p-hydroxybenzoic acid efflux pump subunit AaeB [Methylocystis sp. MJC1]MBU6526474.1 FUSC family protein [Methylocystis sp. MJC1]UZX12915.1 FUSC family protein [Methylocystis sp. MJC1]